MRIGFITGEYPPMQGGVGAFTHELATAMEQIGHRVFVLTDRQAHTEQQASSVSATVRTWNWSRAATWVKATKVDLVNIQYEAAAFRMAALAHRMPRQLLGSAKLPVVTTYHDLLVPYLFPKAGQRRERALFALARDSKGVIATNRQDQTRLCSVVPTVPVEYIPIGSNIPDQPPADFQREQWRQKLSVPADSLLIGYFGFLNASKGADTLIDAVTECVHRGVNCHLLMIGGRTGSSDPANARIAAQINAQINRLGISDRVHWTDFVDNAAVSAYLHTCDIIALPFKDGVSYRRGSFMAGIAHGCAIITTRPEVDSPELIDRVNVRLVRAGSSSELSAVIRELANDPLQRHFLGNHARELAQTFAWDRIASQTITFYESILKNS